MRKFFMFFAFVFIAISFCYTPCTYAQSLVTITLWDGTQYSHLPKGKKKAVIYGYKCRGEANWSLWYPDSENQNRKIDSDQIYKKFKRIDLINPNLSYHNRDKSGKILITLQNNNQFTVQNGFITAICPGYVYYDPISGEEKFTGIALGQIKTIEFASTTPLKSPVDGMLFPPDYKFDPRTGDKLIPAH